MLTHLLGLALLVISMAMSGPAHATGLDSPQAVLDRFAANFSTLDVGAMAALFRPDAIFFGSTVPGLLRGQEGARAYFEQAWANVTPGTMKCDPAAFQQPAPEVSLFATICQLSRPGRNATARVSGAVLHDGEGWRFAELHISVSPSPR